MLFIAKRYIIHQFLLVFFLVLVKVNKSYSNEGKNETSNKGGLKELGEMTQNITLGEDGKKVYKKCCGCYLNHP
jgi:hypothetical protein